MGRVNIAVIDNGIDEGLYNLGQPLHRVKISPELNISNDTDDNFVQELHGTNVAAIIKKYYSDAVLSDIRVLGDTGKGNVQQFLKAVMWCVENNIKLLNLSLGTIDYTSFEQIRKIINYAYKKGVIIVAACSNKMIKTYPASLLNVIGVKSDRKGILKEGQYIFNHYPLDGIEISACGRHKLKAFDGAETEVFPANSYAAPLITAEVGKLMEKYPLITLEEIKIELERNAQNAGRQKLYTFVSRDMNWVEKALIFNLEAAKYPLRRESCFFEAVQAESIKKFNYSEIYSAIAEYINNNADIVSQIDTIVINAEGKACEKADISLSKLIKKLLAYEKNIVFIGNHNERIHCQVLRNIRQRIWTPQWIKKYYGSSRIKIEVPIIAVYDYTGNKLTDTLLMLKNQFEAKGYYPTAVSNIAALEVSGVEFIKHQINEKSISLLKGIYKVNSPDLIILGINAESDSKCISVAEQRLEIDIRILIADAGDIDNINESVNTIFLTNNENSCDDKLKKAKLFNYNQEDYIIRLYEYIIGLFEKDSE